MSTKQRHDSGSGGFTLAELMVVVATLAILAALMLPALGSNRTSSRAFQCLENMKRLQTASLLYANDNSDIIPYNDGETVGGPIIGAAPSQANWVAGSFAFDGEVPPNGSDPAGAETNIWLLGVEGNKDPTGTITNSLVGSIGGYIKDAEVYKCPADRSMAYGQPRVRSCSVNCCVGTAPEIVKFGIYFIPPGYKFFTKTSSFNSQLSPAGCFEFLDENPISINDGFFLYNVSGTGIGDWPAANHDGSGSFSFADGHCELHKWVDAFLSFGSTYNSLQQDPKWLAAHGTYYGN